MHSSLGNNHLFTLNPNRGINNIVIFKLKIWFELLQTCEYQRKVKKSKKVSEKNTPLELVTTCLMKVKVPNKKTISERMIFSEKKDLS